MPNKQSKISPRVDDRAIRLCRPRLLLADSDPLFLHGVSSVLGDTFAICGKVSTASECLALVPMTEILLLGFSLACGRNALGLLRKFRDLQPKIVVIVLLSPMTAWMRPRLIAAGAKGVISRRTSPHDLLNLVEDALQGLPLPAIQVRSAREDSTPGSVDLDLLSTRELEIFRLIGQRQSVKAIAALLGISEKTVSAHRENIKLKLGIRRAAALALVASSHALWEAKGADYLQ